MKHTNITYTQIKKEGTQKAYKLWEGVINDLIEEKQEIKGQKINGMEITGIGAKCLKLENNFIKWDDIFDNFYYEDEKTTTLDDAILSFIFEDYNVEVTTTTYEAKKWSRKEAIENFEEIKEEIIANKQYYKKGKIVGIGEKAVAYTYDGFYNEYVNWDDVKETITKISIKDYIALNKHNHMALTLEAFFFDDEEETTVEKNLREKEDEYAEEKSYIYRHIIAKDITVKNIRGMVFNRHGYNEAETIIKELLNFAFKYVDEVKFTNDGYDEEDANKYVVQNKEGYFFVIKNKEIIYDEEKEGYRFEDYKKAVFKAKGGEIEVYRKGKLVYHKTGGLRQFYISRRKTTEVQIAYELSAEQQIEILKKEGQIRKVTDEEVKEDFMKTVQQENEIGEELRETIQENYDSIEEAYKKSEAVQAIAKELFKEGRIHAGRFYHCLNAIASEPHVDKSKIVGCVMWDDSSTNESVIYEDKYGFDERYESKTITLHAGFNTKTYTYTQNSMYTKVEHSDSYIDSFSVETIYLKGTNISEEDIPYYLEYAYGMWIMRNTLKHMYLYEEKIGEESYSTYIRYKL